MLKSTFEPHRRDVTRGQIKLPPEEHRDLLLSPNIVKVEK